MEVIAWGVIVLGGAVIAFGRRYRLANSRRVDDTEWVAPNPALPDDARVSRVNRPPPRSSDAAKAGTPARRVEQGRPKPRVARHELARNRLTRRVPSRVMLHTSTPLDPAC